MEMIRVENNQLLYELKKTIPDFIDDRGNFKTIPTGKSVRHKLTKEKISLFESLITLLRDTPIINEETRIYIFDKYISYAGVAEKMTEISKKKVKLSNVNGKISYSRNKLEMLFSRTIARDILAGRELDKYRNLIGKAYIRYGTPDSTDYRENILLPLDRKKVCDSLDDDRFYLFLDIIKPYIKSHMERLSSEIDADIIGYFNFIMTSPVLKDTDKERKDLLMQLIAPEPEGLSGSGTKAKNKQSSKTKNSAKANNNIGAEEYSLPDYGKLGEYELPEIE